MPKLNYALCILIFITEDGKFVGDPDAGEFWSLFGGHAPISRDPPSEALEEPESEFVKLFWYDLDCFFTFVESKEHSIRNAKCYKNYGILGNPFFHI